MPPSPPPSFDPSSLQSSEELVSALQILDEMERRQMAAPLLNYQPHAKGRTFHSRSWKKRRAVVAGANKTGKTWMGGHETLSKMYGYRYWEVPGLKLENGDLPPRSKIDPKYWVRNGEGVPIQVPNKGIIVTGLKIAQGIGEVVWPVLDEALPVTVKNHPKFRATKGPQGVVVHLQLPNGSEAILASSEQDDISFEGTRLQWAWFDEPTKANAYSAVWRGLAMDFGPCWFTLTPLGSKCVWLKLDVVESDADDVFFIQVDIDDNPFFAPEAKAAYIAGGTNWSDAERAARLHGEWEAVGGRILHNFNKKHHVIPAQRIPKHWIHGMTVDPHHVRPAFVAWWALDDWGRRIYYREWPAGDFFKMRSGGKSPTEYANLFRSIEGPNPARVRICDPRFGKAEFSMHGDKRSCWAEQMAECGMFFNSRVPNTNLIEIGEQLIIERLRFDAGFPIGPTNTPKILITEDCPNIIRACERYGLKYEKNTESTKERPSEEYKDPVDVMRYTELTPLNPLELGEVWSDDSDLIHENQGE